MQDNKTYSICYIAGRETTYSRTQTVLHALKSSGHRVVPILPPDKSFRHYPALLFKFLIQVRTCDLVVVGFYGHFLILFVRLITRKPILFDALVSTFFVMRDRGKAKKGGLKDRIFYMLDKVAMTAADKIVLETQDHVDARARVFKVPPSRFKRVFLPTVDDVMFPHEKQKLLDPFVVHFHGEFAPFHGVKYIIEAAHMLRDENIHFRIIGSGFTFAEDKRLVEEFQLHNCEFIERVPFAQLPELMSESAACLGIFGDTIRTLHELTNKIVEAMACGAAIITTRSAPVEELLQHEKSALLIPPANPGALADAIRKIQNDQTLRKKLGRNARNQYVKHCHLENFTQEFNAVVHELMGHHPEMVRR